MITKKCLFCGKEFQTLSSNKKHCSNKCRNSFNHPRKVPITKVCDICGKEFQTVNIQQKYCSHQCADKGKKINQQIRWRRYREAHSLDVKTAVKPRKANQHTTKSTVCLACGKKFKQSFYHEKFCSDKCRIDYFW